MLGPQHERAVAEGRLSERGESLGRYFENGLTFKLADGNAVTGEEVIFGVVFPERERVLVLKSGRHK